MTTIEKTSIEELELLLNLSQKTFIETYAAHNSAESLNDYLKSNFNAKKLADELNNPESHFFVAKAEDEVVGYLKVNLGTAQTELANENALEVERIYVLDRYQGKSIGRGLLNKAIEVARQKAVEFVWLGVWENNTKAIGFYERMNFKVFDTHVFMFGKVEQTDLMMKLTLE